MPGSMPKLRGSLLVAGLAFVTTAAVACGSDDPRGAPLGTGGGVPKAGSGGKADTAGGEAGSEAAGGAGGVPAEGGLAGVDAGSGQAGQAQSGGAGGAGGAEAEITLVAFVSPTGSDLKGDGSEAKPFATLTPAIALVQRGEGIGLLDGKHVVDYLVEVPDGSALIAVNPGQATLVGANGSISFEGDGTVDGLRLEDAVNLLTVSAGTVHLTRTSFGAHTDASGSDAAIVVSDAGRVVMDAESPETPWYFETGGGRLVQVLPGGTLELNGGLIEGPSAGSLFLASAGDSQISLSGLTVRSCQLDWVVHLANTSDSPTRAVLSLTDVLVDDCGSTGVVHVGWGEPKVTVTGSTLDSSAGLGIGLEGKSDPDSLVQTVSLTDSQLRGNAVGLKAEALAQAAVTLLNTEVTGNTLAGILFSGTDLTSGSSLHMTGGSLSDNLGRGFDSATETARPVRVTLRGVKVLGNGGHGLHLGGSVAAVFDLGSVAQPGLNVLQNPGTGNAFAALVVDGSSFVNAVGNTWLLSTQGTDATGQYPAGEYDYTEVLGPVSAGQNYRILSSQTLWL